MPSSWSWYTWMPGCTNAIGLGLVDSGKVAMSNPLRQSLYTLNDCLNGGEYKAMVAAKSLSTIFPAVEAEAVVMFIPMPGHPVNSQEEISVREDCRCLHDLVDSHDAIFLLTDSRESRWLPTLLCANANKDLYGEDRIPSSPRVCSKCSPQSMEVEVSECANDKMERPSPISVLEPLFTDDDISPASTKSQSVEKDIQPRHMHFEEQSLASGHGICMRISHEDEESAFEYVEAMLLGLGLNWDELLLRWLSLYEILDSSLFDQDKHNLSGKH